MRTETVELMELFVALIEARATPWVADSGTDVESWLRPPAADLDAAPATLAELDPDGTGLIPALAQRCAAGNDDLAGLLRDLEAVLNDPHRRFDTGRGRQPRLMDFVYPVI